MKQDAGTVRLDLEREHLGAVLALDLHDRLERVDRHEHDAEEAGGHGRARRLDAGVEVARGLVRVEERQRAGVGRRVAETRQRPLQQRRADAAVEAGAASAH